MAGEEQVFLQLTILLLVAVASHFVIKRFRQPTVIGEIGIGFLLGPSVLGYALNGWRAPAPGALTPPFDRPAELVPIFASLGAIFLLFLIGLETDVKVVYQRRNIAVAAGGVVLPWVLGFVTAYLMVPEASLAVPVGEGLFAHTPRFVMAMFVGATLCATSTAIAAAVLRELGMIHTRVATTIMGAVIVDDVLGLLVLALTVGVAGGNVDLFYIVYLVVVAVAFIAVSIFIGTRYFGPLVVWVQSRAKKRELPHAGFMVAMAVAFLAAFLAEGIGLSAVIGAFLAGAMFSSTPLRKDFQEGVEFLGAVFTPIFFISLGLLVNIWEIRSFTIVAFGVVLFIVAFLSKLAGCGLTARWTGLTTAESLAVGHGMIPRGEVGLIIALIAEQSGVIGADLFSIIVVVLVVVSVLPAPLLRRALESIPSEERRVRASPPKSG